MTTTTPPSAQRAGRNANGAVAVRRATSRDAAHLQVMLIELAKHEGDAHHVFVDIGRWAQMLADPRVVVLIAEDATGQLGYVSAVHQLNLWMGRDILNLDDLYVRAEARGQLFDIDASRLRGTSEPPAGETGGRLVGLAAHVTPSQSVGDDQWQLVPSSPRA